MEKMVRINVKWNNGTYAIDVPRQCPHCTTVIRPVSEPNQSTALRFNGKHLLVVVLRAPCCEKHFFATYELTSSKTAFLSSYPYALSPQLPELIVNASPRFAKLYGYAYTAEMNNHVELAGSGYRNALEVLIKDYAISKLDHPREEVVKKTLAGAIETYVPSVNLKNCADVIRILGNDYTHYESRYEGIDFDVLKKYVQVFITALEADLLMREPVIDTKRSPEQTPSESQPLPETARQ